MKNKIALHFLKTVSFKSDGRVLKWLESLQKSNITSRVSVIEDLNQEKSEFYYGSELKYNSFFFRKFFTKRKGYPFKILEYLYKSNKELSKFSSDVDIVIYHDVQQYLNLFWVLFFRRKSSKFVIWDIHELPHSKLERFKATQRFISYILQNVDLIIYTNNERRQYLLRKYKYNDNNRYFVLNNFPSEQYNAAPIAELPIDVLKWLGDDKYVLWLGAANRERNFETFLRAYCEYKTIFKLVIIGKIDPFFKDELDVFINDGLIYNNFVPQNEIIKYVDNAYFSVVLYNNISPNNFLCEPNRLFQLINRNIPCIVGCNPTLSSVIIESGGGIVLNDSGTDQREMVKAFELMSENRELYQANIIRSQIKEKFNWDIQFTRLSEKFL